jgi:hypothetical protein
MLFLDSQSPLFPRLHRSHTKLWFADPPAGEIGRRPHRLHPHSHQINAILGGLQSVVGEPAKLATKENLNAAIDGVKSLMKTTGQQERAQVGLSEKTCYEQGKSTSTSLHRP